jgi:hypothetical protein
VRRYSNSVAASGAIPPARRPLAIWRPVVHEDGIVPASNHTGVNGAIEIVAVLNGGVVVIGIASHIPSRVPDVPDGA